MPHILYELTADLLRILAEERRRELPPDQQLAVQELLRRLPADFPASELPFVLTPLLANNPAEQDRLHELFALCWEKRRAAFEQALPQPPPVDSEERRWRWRIIIPAAILLLALAAGLAYWFWPETPVVQTATEGTGRDSVTTVVEAPPAEDNILFEPLPLPYDHPWPPPQTDKTPAWKSWLAENWDWLRWALLLPFSLLLLAIWRYIEYRRRKLVAEQRAHDKPPPYFWNIRIPGADDIVMGEGYAYALQVLRRRAIADQLALDMPRTIRATAERGGLPDFRFRRRSQPVEYLMLIDRQTAQNHRAQLFDRVYQAFREQEIEIARFFYGSDLRSCFNEETHPQGVSLAELQNRYGAARLIIVGTGAQLLNPATNRLAAWTGMLGNWKDRVLLTPKPLLDWGQNERRLAELLPVLPATLQGLGCWVDELDSGEDARFDTWRERVSDAPITRVNPDPDNPLPVLQQYYGPQQLRWIAACAIYPSLHWDLTTWLGRLLTEDPDAPLVTLDQLLHLFRLPWFVQGEIPVAARIALLDWLEQSEPGLLNRLRADIAGLLQQSPPPKDSAAWDQYRLSVALQQWLSTTDPAERKKLEREIARLLESGAEPDFAVVKHLQKPGPLDFIVPRAWRKYVHPGGFAALGWLPTGKALYALLGVWAVGLVALFWPYGFAKTPECASTVTYRGAEYCLATPRDSLLYLEKLALDTLAKHDVAAFDALAAQASTVATRADSLGAQFHANVAMALFNEGVPYYQRSPDAPLDSACLYFQKTGRYDSAAVFPQPDRWDYRGNLEQCRAWCNGLATPTEDSLATQEQYADARTRAVVAQYRAFCRQKGYKFYDQPGELNLVALRRSENVITDRWEDFLLVLYLDAGNIWRMAAYPATTMPGKGSVDERNRVKILRSAQFLSVYVPGKGVSGGSPKLKQVGGVFYYVDSNQNSRGDEFDNGIPEYSGSDINSPVSSEAPTTVGNYSNGNIALQRLSDMRQFQTLYEAAYKKTKTPFTLTLLTASEAPRLARYFFNGQNTAPVEPGTAPAPGDSTRTGQPVTSGQTIPVEGDAGTPSLVPRPNMVRISGGTFEMGDVFDDNGQEDEKPVHRVTVSSFYLAATELTFAEYDLFCEMTKREKPADEGWGRDKRPVIHVSWNDAIDYCNWLSEQHGYRPAYTRNDDAVACDWSADGYRLPTEAEWEYAARAFTIRSGGGQGGGTVRFGNGQNIADPAGINFNSSADDKKDYSVVGENRGQTVPVGSLNSPNPHGLHDMSGNVYEWCWDWFRETYYSNSPTTQPRGPDAGTGRVARGGSWKMGPEYNRAANRNAISPWSSSRDFGFRLARAVSF